MAKSLIDGKRLLDDMQAGMSDAELMMRYNLSPPALKALVAKLVEMGALRTISAKALLKDIRSGVTNKELMRKHKLSPATLKRLFKEMTDAGIAFFQEQRAARSKKGVNISQVVSDIRAGATETYLMETYELSSRGLQSTFWKLVRSGIMTWDELLDSYPGLEDSVTLRNIRQTTRSYPLLSLEAYDANDPTNRGKVIDLSEKGVGIIGLRVQVNERIGLFMNPSALLGLKSISFEVECRWVIPAAGRPEGASGFEITHIDGSNLRKLRKLIQTMTVTFD
jgi:uncharacterized protein (DUF433 family)